MDNKNKFKCGYVAIIGEPNVGKSTLMNAILGQKISIVTPKPQTTRQRIIGIFNRSDAQVIFLDTPGLINPKYLLQEEMVKTIDNSLRNSDIVLVMISIEKIELPINIVERIKEIYDSIPVILTINKIDETNKERIDELIKKYKNIEYFKEVIPISALNGVNVKELLDVIINYLPEQSPFFPDDILSEQPQRFFAAEFIRESIFEDFYDEIPYSTAVEVVDFKERDKGKIYICANILVERESQKKIIIGKNGESLKKIGIKSRKKIEDFLCAEIFLELRVKVREKWRKNKSMIKKLGYSSN